MKRFIGVISLAVALLVLSGCGVPSFVGGTNQNVIQTNINLSDANYRVIGTASGEDTIAYFFGIGGLNTRKPYDNAVAKMYQNANLQGHQAMVNVNVTKYIKSVLGIYMEITTQATGTIIEFIE